MIFKLYLHKNNQKDGVGVVNIRCMETRDSDGIIDDNKHLLVSDSKEIGTQYDSKKLPYSELLELMQDNMFRKHLSVL